MLHRHALLITTRLLLLNAVVAVVVIPSLTISLSPLDHVPQDVFVSTLSPMLSMRDTLALASTARRFRDWTRSHYGRPPPTTLRDPDCLFAELAVRPLSTNAEQLHQAFDYFLNAKQSKAWLWRKMDTPCRRWNHETPFQLALRADHAPFVRVVVDFGFSGPKQRALVFAYAFHRGTIGLGTVAAAPPPHRQDEELLEFPHLHRMLQASLRLVSLVLGGALGRARSYATQLQQQQTDGRLFTVNLWLFAQGTALQVAVRWGRVDMVRILVELGASVVDPPLQDETAHLNLPLPVQGSSPAQIWEQMTWVPPLDVPEDWRHQEPHVPNLVHAIRMQNMDMVIALLESGADVNVCYRGKPALLWAAQLHSQPLVDCLLEHGADPALALRLEYAAGGSLHRAVTRQQLVLVKLLLRAGVDPNERIPSRPVVPPPRLQSELGLLYEQCNALMEPRTELPLIEAIRIRSLPLVRILLDAGANLGASGNFGTTPLHYLISQLDADLSSRSIADWIFAEIAKLPDTQRLPLLETPNSMGSRPLEYALWAQRNCVCAKRLLQLGADPNVRIGMFQQPILLSCLASPQCRTCVPTLLESGGKVDVNICDRRGRTALHVAVTLPHQVSLQAVQWLVQSGANVNAKDGRGATPLDLAVLQGRRSGRREVITFLVGHGAKHALWKQLHQGRRLTSHPVDLLVEEGGRFDRDMGGSSRKGWWKLW